MAKRQRVRIEDVKVRAPKGMLNVTSTVNWKFGEKPIGLFDRVMFALTRLFGRTVSYENGYQKNLFGRWHICHMVHDISEKGD